jgi:hypothetical protein
MQPEVAFERVAPAIPVRDLSVPGRLASGEPASELR